MDHIRSCHVYKKTSCNCPEDICRRQLALEEAEDYDRNIRKKEQDRFNDLLEFQFFLQKLGIITRSDTLFNDTVKMYLSRNPINEEE